MSAAWEQRRIDIVVGILHTWNTPPDFTLGMMRLHKQGKFHYAWEHDTPFDIARNKVARVAMDLDAQWLLFIDSDIIPPPDGLDILLSRNLPIIGGLYFRRHPDVHPAIYRKVNAQQFEPINMNRVSPGINEVDGIGAGFLLIQRRVLDSLKDEVPKLKMGTLPTALELYEFFKYDVFHPPYCSEDLWFCDLAKKKGWKIYVDTSVGCGHMTSSIMVNANGKFDWSPLEVPKP